MPEERVSILVELRDLLTGPLGTIRRNIGALATDARKVSQQFAPLTRGIVAFAAAAAGTATVGRALDLAERQVQAERNLLAALQGRTETTRELIRLAGELQAKTTLGDEALIEQEALLVRMGVAARQIPEAIQVAADTAAALGLELSAAVKGIGLALTVGRAGELGERIGDLAALQREGRLASEVLRVLGDRFRGAAAAAADTDFGGITQQGNLLGDALEEVGKAIAPLKAQILSALVSGLRAANEALGSPAGRSFVEALKAAVPLAVQVAAALAGIAAAGVAVRVLAFLGSTVALLTAAAIQAALVAASVLALLEVARIVVEIVTGTDQLGSAVGGVVDGARSMAQEFGDVLAAIKEGRLETRDLFDLIETKIENIRIRLDRYIIQPLSKFFEGLFTTFKALSTLIGGGLELIGLNFIRQVDKIRNSAADVLSKLGVDIGRVTDAQLLATSTAILKAENEVQGAINALGDTFGPNGSFATIFDSFAGTEAEIDRRNAELAERLSRRFIEVANNATAAADKAVVDQARVRDRFIAQAAEDRRRALSALEGTQVDLSTITPDGARKLLETVDDELRQPLQELLAGVFQEQFRRGELSAADFAREVAALSRSSTENQIREQERLRAAEQERLIELQRRFEGIGVIAEEIQRRSFVVDPTAPSGFSRDVEAAKALVTANENQAAVAGEIAETQNRIATIEKARAKLIFTLLALGKEELEQRRKLAEETISLVEKEATRVSEAAQRNLELLRSGDVGVADAFRAIEAEISVLDRTAAKAQAEVKALLSDPGRSALSDDAVKATADIKRLTEAAAKARLEFARGISEFFASGSGDVERQRSEIAALLTEGRISSSEAANKEAAAFAAFNAEAMRVEATLRSIRDLSPEIAPQIDNLLRQGQEVRQTFAEPPSGNFFTGIEAGVRNVVTQFDELRELGLAAGGFLVDSFIGFIDVLAQGGAAFSEFALKFLREISLMIVKLIVFKALSAALGFSGGGQVGEGANFADNLGGVLFATGGKAPGVDRGRDEVLAYLRPEEWVIRPEAVRFYGDEIMHAINSMLLPRSIFSGPRGRLPAIARPARFAEGGAVSGTSSAAGGGGLLVADSLTMERLIAGGDPAMRRWMRTNGAFIRSVLPGGGV